MRAHAIVPTSCLGIFFAGVLCLPSVGNAQTRQGPRAPLERAAEITLARSAAPAPVSANARIWVWSGNRYEIADSGQSAINCYVGRPWDVAIEPHCFDAESSRTIMPIQMRKVELYVAGKSDEAVNREIADGLAAGRFKLPERPAITYMMSAAQQLVNGQGSNVGAWEPHLMIYYPYLTTESVGLPEFVPGVGFIENPGQALSVLVVPLKTFVPHAAHR
jgi:hypothetical protein